MADTALPPQASPDVSAAGTAKSAMSNGVSWAGWAISSFTNKPPRAKGEIQPAGSQGGASQASNATRASSMPRTTVKSPSRGLETTPTTSSDGHRIARTQSERPPETTTIEDDGFEAWGSMAEERDKDHEQEEADALFEARESPSPVPSATPSVPFDDGGEPDFAGWLAAQSKAKTKKVLPKGLSKSSTTTSTTAKSSTTRSSTTSSKPIISGASTAAKPKRIVQPPKKVVETKPKVEPTAEEDDWGEAWD
ncbi:kinase family protein [Coccidioides immitis H538.4]|nr:kinase family protein [Coccidioides immitis H538.4]